MKKSSFYMPKFIVPLGLSLIFSLPLCAEPNNLSLLKQEVKTYHDSGTYEREIAKQATKAEQYLINRALRNNHQTKQKLALVLDIDETSVSNYASIIKDDFANNPKHVHQHILAANAPPIQPMLKLYRTALAHGIKVFFVTGRRDETERQATKKNLLNAGFAQWSGLYLRPSNDTLKSVIPFKSQTRAKIAAQGYTIIASIGDQYSDLLGGHAERVFKLPNPYYYLP